MKFKFSGNLKSSSVDAILAEQTHNESDIKDFVLDRIKDLEIGKSKIIDIFCSTYIVWRIE
jgi:hypothetical protein